jgi:hypothetical protein
MQTHSKVIKLFISKRLKIKDLKRHQNNKESNQSLINEYKVVGGCYFSRLKLRKQTCLGLDKIHTVKYVSPLKWQAA